MKAKVSYDSEADMGYIYLNANKKISIDLTEELEVNPFHGYSLRISEKAVKSKYRVSGITLCFLDEEYQGFVGFDLDVPEE